MKRTLPGSTLEIWSSYAGKFLDKDTVIPRILQIEAGSRPGEYIVEVLRRDSQEGARK